MSGVLHTKLSRLRSCEAGEDISGLLDEVREVLWSLVILIQSAQSQ